MADVVHVVAAAARNSVAYEAVPTVGTFNWTLDSVTLKARLQQRRSECVKVTSTVVGSNDVITGQNMITNETQTVQVPLRQEASDPHSAITPPPP